MSGPVALSSLSEPAIVGSVTTDVGSLLGLDGGEGSGDVLVGEEADARALGEAAAAASGAEVRAAVAGGDDVPAGVGAALARVGDGVGEGGAACAGGADEGGLPAPKAQPSTVPGFGS
jgi:hypothetical protein